MFFLEDSVNLEAKEDYLFFHGRTLSGHTWSTAKKFSILNLSSLHPYGKPYLGHTAWRRFTLLSDGSCCSTTAHNYSGTGCLLGWSSAFLLLWTLAPHDCITYCQAQGLSGHTSPCGECALSLSGTCPGTSFLLGWFFTILQVSDPDTT